MSGKASGKQEREKYALRSCSLYWFAMFAIVKIVPGFVEKMVFAHTLKACQLDELFV